MQQRTPTLVPVLPQLVRAAEARLQHATLLLQAARSAKPGDELTISRYRRTGRNGSHWRPTALFLAPVDQPGPRFDAECKENNAFWTWASIEVLRRAKARIEELLELTHLSLRQYQAPAGETVPLLQISPFKTDRERVIPAARTSSSSSPGSSAGSKAPASGPLRGVQPAGDAYDGLPEFFRFGPMQDRFLGLSTKAMGPKTPVLGCECGEWACWPLMARITATADFVIWDGFEQPHRKARDYVAFGPFQLDRHQYDDALQALSATIRSDVDDTRA
ncbi:hypothetical protein GCM10010394_55270 [Streptomyces crystallinus]|uniref:Uncharacterized protein n=2 Tax=Streptomyces crystallinus TaxID=68191 RepID=A0ABN1GS58_9ACTN